MANSPAAMEYPLQLGLAYLLLVGYLMRTLFVTAKLPGAVGVLLSGFMFSHFMQSEIMEGRDEYQESAFFLVLLTAGCEISVRDLRPYMVVLGLVPCTFELMGVALYAYFFLDFSAIESAVTGTVLFSLADGLVIPKMGEFGNMYPGHYLPRLMFTCAPLEASWALTLFGIIQGFAEQSRQPQMSAWVIVLANVVRLVATVAAGWLLGYATGEFLNRRQQMTDWGIRFTNKTVEAYLVILAVALAAFSLGLVRDGDPLVPMGFCPGPMFQPELLVIVLGSSFGSVTETVVLHGIESTMGGVWVFGQLILFSMLGSKSDVSVFENTKAFPLLLIGLSCRLVGVLVATFGTLKWRKCSCDQCAQANRSKAWSEALFIYLASLPRATIQGALGPVPATQRFFHSDPSRVHVQRFIASTAKLYIVSMSIVGSLLLHTLGPKVLENTNQGQKCSSALSAVEEAETEMVASWKASHRELAAEHRKRTLENLSSLLDEDADLPEDLQRASSAGSGGSGLKRYMTMLLQDQKDSQDAAQDEGMKRSTSQALSAISKEYDIDEDVVASILERHAGPRRSMSSMVANAPERSIIQEFAQPIAPRLNSLWSRSRGLLPIFGNDNDGVSRLQVF